MKFGSVLNGVEDASLAGFGLKTVIHDRKLKRNSGDIKVQYRANLQTFNYRGINPETGNIAEAGRFASYLISLYCVLKRVPQSRADSEYRGFWTRARAVLMAKEKEYAKGGNRYHNFHEAIEINEQLEGEVTQKSQVVLGMAMKHIVSVQDLIAQLGDDLDKPRTKDEVDRINYLLDEKFGDLVNYVVLLTGFLLETE